MQVMQQITMEVMLQIAMEVMLKIIMEMNQMILQIIMEMTQLRILYFFYAYIYLQLSPPYILGGLSSQLLLDLSLKLLI